MTKDKQPNNYSNCGRYKIYGDQQLIHVAFRVPINSKQEIVLSVRKILKKYLVKKAKK